MTPAWSISADGVDITSRFNDRLLELTVTDNEGLKSDSCEILVDDRDGQLAIPRKGAILAISMGYRETGLTFMGLYTVDEVEVSGFPRQMRISASAADLREKLKEQRSKGYDKKKIGDIVGEIAKRHNLKPAVSSALKDFEYEHLAQSEGWHSPLTLACIGVTAAAAIAPPCAERAFRDWQPVKGALLLVFFLLAVAFSLTVSIGRAGGHREAAAASGEAENMRARLAQQAYDDARAAVAAECATGRGKLCRAAEERRDKAREALAERAEVKPADSGATRIAHLPGIAPETVAMYAPLALPFALELGGFIFLAFGLAPRRGRKAS